MPVTHFRAKTARRPGHRDRFQQRVRDDRHHDVQVEVAVHAGDRDRRVVADDERGHWFTASGITGFTLPGMMLDPGCVAGSSISFNPVRLPEVRRRRSFAIFMRPTASVRSAPDVSTAASRFCIASNRSGAVTNGRP
jgi:hypothetical protein